MTFLGFIQIFGPGKKLGSLILFTMCLLIITSCVSLQLFCSFKDFHKFATFPQVRNIGSLPTLTYFPHKLQHSHAIHVIKMIRLTINHILSCWLTRSQVLYHFVTVNVIIHCALCYAVVTVTIHYYCAS